MAAVVAKTKEISGRVYGVVPMLGWDGLEMLGRLGKFMAPALLGALSTGQDLDVQALAPALTMAFRSIEPGELTAISKALLHATTCDGKPVIVETIPVTFQGKTFELLKVLWFALEVNYADFFDAAKKRIAEKQGSPEAIG